MVPTPGRRGGQPFVSAASRAKAVGCFVMYCFDTLYYHSTKKIPDPVFSLSSFDLSPKASSSKSQNLSLKKANSAIFEKMTLVSRGEKGGFDVEKGVYVLDDETEVAAVDEDADEKLVDADDVVDEMRSKVGKTKRRRKTLIMARQEVERESPSVLSAMVVMVKGRVSLCEPDGLTGTDFDMVPFIMADVEGWTMSAAELISSSSCVIDITDSLCQRQLRTKQRSPAWGTHLDASAGKSSAVSIGVCPE
ncbi:hypothetical protein IMY05_C4741000500 [Salix suchowensis]|nr:hypothetical protein IMY05_C4741000500 [Salix suchowensis]